jgi:hypothetical protein
MPDTVSILSSASHGNVASESRGTTLFLVGSRNGQVPLRAQRKSDPVDVSEYSQLRLELSVSGMSHRGGFENGRPDAASLHVTLEHSADGLTWDVLHEFAPMREIGKQRAVLGAFEGTIRASWFFVRHANEAAGIAEQVAITWALSAQAVPTQPE